MLKKIARKHAKRKLSKAFLRFLKAPGMPLGPSLVRSILPPIPVASAAGARQDGLQSFKLA